MFKILYIFLIVFFGAVSVSHCEEERMKDSSKKIYFYYNKNAKIIISNIIFDGSFSYVAVDLQFPDGKLVKCMRQKDLKNFISPYIVPEIEFVPIESDDNCIMPKK